MSLQIQLAGRQCFISLVRYKVKIQIMGITANYKLLYEQMTASIDKIHVYKIPYKMYCLFVLHTHIPFTGIFPNLSMTILFQTSICLNLWHFPIACSSRTLSKELYCSMLLQNPLLPPAFTNSCSWVDQSRVLPPVIRCF